MLFDDKITQLNIFPFYNKIMKRSKEKYSYEIIELAKKISEK